MKLAEINATLFADAVGNQLAREYGRTPNGAPLAGSWVLRRKGVYVDHDQYRNDVAERNKCELSRDYRCHT